MNFTQRQFRRLKSRLRKRYQTKWKKIRTNLRHFPPGLLKTWVLDNDELLATYTNFNWFFLTQLETYFFLQNIKPVAGSETSLSEDEDLIFETWNNSEFADIFLKQLNKGKSVATASQFTLKHLEKHLITLGKRHVEKIEASSSAYRVQTVLGERLRKGKISPMLGTTLHLEGKELDLKTHSLKEMNVFSQRIELALKLVRRYSPTSWERFINFTDVIIPIRDKEFVSYSHQNFPCASMINLYDRDFLDLSDDLLHENGHHHLNHYLNLEKLIEEPSEMIYYSPWRRSQRPLRGIYHAYFTFFWAFKLFSDLANSDLDNIWYKFSDEEKEKIHWRAVEEFHMLDFSFQELKWARRKKLIHDEGWKLISEQQKELTKFRKKIPLWERRLKKNKKELLKLKKELTVAKKKFKKS